jgi:hypothetical protein
VTREELDNALHEGPRTWTLEDVLSGNADAGSYVLLEGIALHFGVQTATVKKRAADLGLTLVKIRKPEAKNAYCAAVTTEDARRIAETFHAGNIVNNARVLGPDEISKLMEE